MTVTLLPLKFDAEELLSIYDSMHNSLDSMDSYQTYVTSLDGNTYTYSLEYIKEQVENRNFHMLNNCDVMNKFFRDSYIEEVYNTVKECYNISRCRFMVLDRMKRGYSYHKDASKRLHIPLVTNEDAIVLVEDNIHRLDELGRLYLVDTTKKHTAINLGWTTRIHLVFDLKLENLDNVQHSKRTTR